MARRKHDQERLPGNCIAETTGGGIASPPRPKEIPVSVPDLNTVQREGLDHLDPNLAPRAGQPYAEMFELQRQQQAELEPDEPEAWATLTPLPVGSWRFVTVPGIGGTSIRLDLPVETDDRDESVNRKNKYKRWLDRQIRSGRIEKSDVGKDGLLKADSAVFELLGSYTLVFRPVRDATGKRRKQAEYVTTEKVVADYIRARLNRGDFPEIVEDVRPVQVEIDGELVEMMPVTDAGRRRVAMAAAAAG